MKKETRQIAAFILNFLWPGLGFYFSGAKHNNNWLRLLGLGLIVLFLFLSIYNISLIGYRISDIDLCLTLLIAFFFAFLGAFVEYKIGEQEERAQTAF